MWKKLFVLSIKIDKFWTRPVFFTVYVRALQLAARGPHPARKRQYSGPPTDKKIKKMNGVPYGLWSLLLVKCSDYSLFCY